MKYEWRKQDKALYLPKNEVQEVVVAPYNYFMIKGQGNPNEEDFSNRVGALYALSYGIKMLPKKGVDIEGYFDYAIFPLEGIWTLTEEGVRSMTNQKKLDKSQLKYKIMIRQPDFVTQAMALEVMENVKKKKKISLIDEVTFERLEEGKCVQIMHYGPFDDEPNTFKKLTKYCEEKGLTRKGYEHKEIYTKDSRKTDPQNLETVLRYWID